MTRPQLIGAASALALALTGIYLGTRTVTNPTASRACVPFEGTKPGGLLTTRAYGVRLSPQAAGLLGLAQGDEWQYVAMEIQHTLDEAPAAMLARLNMHADLVDKVEDRASPLFPTCQIAVVRSDDALYPAKCACSTGVDCTWTPPLPGGGYGAAVEAPRNLTLSPGTFSGAGCRKKPCVALASGNPYESMPGSCR